MFPLKLRLENGNTFVAYALKLPSESITRVHSLDRWARLQMRAMASRILLIGANLLIPIAILIYARGFFPYKPFLSGLAQYEELEYGPPPVAPFDKLIFMVVDALRR